MIGSSTQKTNQTTTSQPWQPAQPGLNQILSGAQGWMNNAQNLQFSNGSTVAGFDPLQSQAIASQGQRATAGSPVVQNADQYTNDVLQGKYLNSNPGFGAMTQSITDSVLPSLNATFGAAGRTGSNLNQYSTARGLGDALAAPTFQNYQNERNLQQSAAGNAIPLANQDYTDLSKLFSAGQANQDQAQNVITNYTQPQFQFNQNRPLMGLQQGAGLITPIAGLGGTSNSQGTTQTSANPFTAALGGLGLLGSFAMPGLGGVSAAGNLIGGLSRISL